jgi:hypothetical protein
VHTRTQHSQPWQHANRAAKDLCWGLCTHVYRGLGWGDALHTSACIHQASTNTNVVIGLRSVIPASVPPGRKLQSLSRSHAQLLGVQQKHNAGMWHTSTTKLTLETPHLSSWGFRPAKHIPPPSFLLLVQPHTVSHTQCPSRSCTMSCIWLGRKSTLTTRQHTHSTHLPTMPNRTLPTALAVRQTSCHAMLCLSFQATFLSKPPNACPLCTLTHEACLCVGNKLMTHHGVLGTADTADASSAVQASPESQVWARQTGSLFQVLLLYAQALQGTVSTACSCRNHPVVSQHAAGMGCLCASLAGAVRTAVAMAASAHQAASSTHQYTPRMRSTFWRHMGQGVPTLTIGAHSLHRHLCTLAPCSSPTSRGALRQITHSSASEPPSMYGSVAPVAGPNPPAAAAAAGAAEGGAEGTPPSDSRVGSSCCCCCCCCGMLLLLVP